MRILLTTTSFQDCPGSHHDLLNSFGFSIDKIRGPVTQEILLPIIQKYDGVICGDDHFTKKVLNEGSKGNLRVISKYGIGLDRIDLEEAKKLNIHVTNCPGVNHITVSEHVIGLILNFYKNLYDEFNYTKSNKWERLIGEEVYGKSIGVAGLGRIGKEVLLRAKAFGLKLYAYDQNFDHDFIHQNNVIACKTLKEIIGKVDILSLNMGLNKDNYECIDSQILSNYAKRGIFIVNTARGQLVNETDLLNALNEKIISGYATDVLSQEPMKKNHPFIKNPKIFITPHIGSRTIQSIERQGVMAVKNLIRELDKIEKKPKE